MQERDFLQAVQGMNLKQRILAVQVGDYIEMSAQRFRRLLPVSRLFSGDPEVLPSTGEIRVKITKIIARSGDYPLKIAVVSHGVEIEVFASLFYKYKFKR